MNYNKYNTILSIAVLAMLMGLTHVVANEKIDAKRDSRAPAAVRNAPIAGEFIAEPQHIDSYKNRKRLSRQNGLSYVEDHYIVRFKETVFPYALTGKRHGSISSSNRRILQILSEEGASLQEVAQILVDSVGGELIDVYDSTIEGFAAYLPKDGVAKIRKDPLVKSIENDVIIKSNQVEWGLDRIDENDLPLDGDFHPAKTGAGVHVYVVDSGIRSTHEEFTNRVGNGFYASSFSSVDDDYFHGTFVAGIAVGESFGVAPQATIHPVKVLDSIGEGTITDICSGVEWVEDNAITPAVCNLSLGGVTSITTIDDAVQSLIDSGIVAVVAAGNDSVNVSTVTPARVDDAITVGSTTNTDSFSSFSNFGTGVDILAPGSGVTSADIDNDTDSVTDSGTSYAAPHVAGAVALYLQDNPSATTAQVRSHLVQQAVSNTITASTLPSGTPNRFLNIVHAGFNDPPAPSNVVISILWPFPIFSLSWNDDASNETHYVIERSTNLVNWSEFDRTFANVESEVNGLPSGTSFFRLRADSHAGMGSFTFASSGGSPPPGSVTIYSSDGSGDIYYNDYSQTVNVPSGGVASAYVDAWSDTYNSYASAEVSGQGEYIYADASGSYEYDSFDGASSGSYYLYADHYSDGWDYAEGSAHIDW